MVPVKSGEIRKSLNLKRTQVACEARMQAGVLTWIKTRRYLPYDSQIEKIEAVYRKHGWKGETETLLKEVF